MLNYDNILKNKSTSGINMKVISLINGSMISENSSMYALHYAKSFNLKLSLVHIKESDELLMIEKVFKGVEKVAAIFNLEVELFIHESFNEFEDFLQNNNVDIIFCSTKQQHSIYENSFAKKIIKMNLKVDLAIVKIVKLGSYENIENIIMPIRGHHLSVNKFTFFATMVNAYNASAEIFSIDEIKRSQIASLDAKKVNKKLQEITFNLRHYFRFAKLMDMKFSIKHHFTLTESEDVQSHIAKNDYDLSIVGGHHEKRFFSSHPIDILFERPIINTIYHIEAKNYK